MKLSFKAKRNIGLIVLTLAVVLAVFLIVFFVNKADENNQIKDAHIGQQLESKKLSFKVNDMKIKNSFADIVASDGKCLMVVNVTATAKKDVELKRQDFSIEKGEQKYSESEEYNLLDSINLKSGQSVEFYLVFEVAQNQMASFYLTAYNYKIDLGGSMVDVWG